MENTAIIFNIVCKEWWEVLFFLFVESNYWLAFCKEAEFIAPWSKTMSIFHKKGQKKFPMNKEQPMK